MKRNSNRRVFLLLLEADSDNFLTCLNEKNCNYNFFGKWYVYRFHWSTAKYFLSKTLLIFCLIQQPFFIMWNFFCIVRLISGATEMVIRPVRPPRWGGPTSSTLSLVEQTRSLFKDWPAMRMGITGHLVGVFRLRVPGTYSKSVTVEDMVRNPSAAGWSGFHQAEEPSSHRLGQRLNCER